MALLFTSQYIFLVHFLCVFALFSSRILFTSSIFHTFNGLRRQQCELGSACCQLQYDNAILNFRIPINLPFKQMKSEWVKRWTDKDGRIRMELENGSKMYTNNDDGDIHLCIMCCSAIITKWKMEIDEIEEPLYKN